MSVRLANLIISLSLIDPEGCITAEIPDWTSFSIPSTKGKNASEAATISLLKSWNLFILSIAIWQLSSLLGWPEPIPTVASWLAKTIAFDFTYLQILNAKIKFFSWDLLGFFFETTLKFLILNFSISSDCVKIESLEELNLIIFLIVSFDASIIRKFFFFF